MKSRWGVRLRYLTVALAASTVAFLICEIVLRLLRPGDDVHTTATLGIYAPEPELGWALKPDIRVSRRWAGRTVLIRTDAAGQRIPDVKASKTAADRSPSLKRTRRIDRRVTPFHTFPRGRYERHGSTANMKSDGSPPDLKDHETNPNSFSSLFAHEGSHLVTEVSRSDDIARTDG
jgi:hypothetical protein